jgi:hypothetical protein
MIGVGEAPANSRRRHEPLVTHRDHRAGSLSPQGRGRATFTLAAESRPQDGVSNHRPRLSHSSHLHASLRHSFAGRYSTPGANGTSTPRRSPSSRRCVIELPTPGVRVPRRHWSDRDTGETRTLVSARSPSGLDGARFGTPLAWNRSADWSARRHRGAQTNFCVTFARHILARRLRNYAGRCWAVAILALSVADAPE